MILLIVKEFVLLWLLMCCEGEILLCVMIVL